MRSKPRVSGMKTLTHKWGGRGSVSVRQRSRLQLHQLGLRDPIRSKNSDLGQWTPTNRHLIAGVQVRAGLAVLVDLVRQSSAVDDAEAEVEKEVGNAGEEADGSDALLFGLFEQRAKQPAASPLALGFGFDDDGADLGKVRSIEVKCAAAEEDARLGFSHRKVADVLA